MPLEFITAEQRMAAPPRINIALLGPHGIGKTAQCRTLNPKSTLFLDGEAGKLALGTWGGTMIDIRQQALKNGLHPWQFAQGLASWISGPDPSDLDGPYCQAMHEQYLKVLGPVDQIAHVRTIFVDSVTVIGRWSFEWAKRQPEAFTQDGRADTWGLFGLHARQMLRWLTVLQHASRSIVVACALDHFVDKGLETWEAQIEGSKTGRELPGIFDQVVTLNTVSVLTDATKGERADTLAFICHTRNPWGFPAKDRSGCLSMLEPPNLAKLMEKIAAGQRLDAELTTTMPAAAAQ